MLHVTGCSQTLSVTLHDRCQWKLWSQSWRGELELGAPHWFSPHAHTHPHSEMFGGPSLLWASSSSSPAAVAVPSVHVDCARVCPQASEPGPEPGLGSGSGPVPELLVWGMVYTLEESADIQYLAPRASGLPEWCEPLSRWWKERKKIKHDKITN